MKIIHFFAMILAAMSVCACHEKPDDGGKGAAADWSLAAPLVEKVEILSGDTLLETYEYGYDDQNRLLSLRNTYNSSGEVLQELAFTYPGEGSMRASGKFYPISTSRYIEAQINDGSVTCKGSWSGAWTYTTFRSQSGCATKTESGGSFASSNGKYSSDTRYTETYTVEDGCIVMAVAGSEVSSKTSRASSAKSSSALTYEYKYSGNDDRQNFAAYLMPCNFPVWLAAGLPGCKKLITDISSRVGGVRSPAHTHLDYTLDASGNIETAVRTDYNENDEVLVRTYKFYYK